MKETIPRPFSLENRSVWVFGGAGYLGQSVVTLLSEMGCRVLCVDLPGRAENFVQTLGLPSAVIPASLDVRDGAKATAFVREQIREHGVPDGLVNLTFASTAKKMEDLTEQDFDDVNHGGITSTFLLAREAGTAMAERGSGSLVLFSSMYGAVSPYPEVYQAPMTKNPVEYGVGKAGIVQMTRYLAVHWGKSGVRCNCISPGPFPNPAVQREHPDFIQRLSEKSPMGRIGQPSEIAGAVAFLLSDASSYLTGHNLPVDGGWTCW